MRAKFFESMEKYLEQIIRSFLRDFSRKKLILLDNILFFLLLKKERFLLQEERNEASRAETRGFLPALPASGQGRKQNFIHACPTGRHGFRRAVLRPRAHKKYEKILEQYYDYKNLIYEKALRRHKNYENDFLAKSIFSAPTRLIFILTHSCQLRCQYCAVRKFSSHMTEDVLFKGIDLIFGSWKKNIQIQFFGGEPLLRFDLLKKGVLYAEKLNLIFKKTLTFILTTNGILLTKEKIEFLKQHNFTIECSIDGEIKNQLLMRKAKKGVSFYQKMVENLEYLFKAEIHNYSISVFMPKNIQSCFNNIKHLLNIGFKRFQVNYALGVFWPKEAIQCFFEEIKKIESFIGAKKHIQFINLTEIRKEPVVLNAELTLDCDGSLYLETGICLEEDFGKMKSNFLVANLKNAKDINFYANSSFQNFYLLSKIYGASFPEYRKIILNNIQFGFECGAFFKNILSLKSKKQ